MNTKHIISTYFMNIILFIFSILGSKKVIRKENMVEITIFTIVGKEEIMENREFFNKILRVLIIIFCILVYVYAVIPSIKDLPRVINNDFCTVEGISIRRIRYDDSESRMVIAIKDENGKKHKISCNYNDDIYVGDEFKIVYLPNLKIGKVKEHKKNADR